MSCITSVIFGVAGYGIIPVSTGDESVEDETVYIWPKIPPMLRRFPHKPYRLYPSPPVPPVVSPVWLSWRHVGHFDSQPA